ncbi:MAG: hypothetical protein ACR2IV_10115 [Bryobacteraceae bacterium]
MNSGIQDRDVLFMRNGRRISWARLTKLFLLLANAGYSWFSVNYHNLADIRAVDRFIECPGRLPIEHTPLLIAEDTGVALALEVVNRGGFRDVIGFGAAKNVAVMQDPHVPVTLFHGAADKDVNPEPLERACRAWTKCRFELIPDGIHNVENWHPAEWEWKEEFTAILRNGGQVFGTTSFTHALVACRFRWTPICRKDKDRSLPSSSSMGEAGRPATS